MQSVDRPEPRDVQPRLSRWGHAWRVLVMLGISAVGWLPVVAHQSDAVRVLDVGLGLASYLLVFWRRRWPLPIALALTLVSAVSGSASGPAVLAVTSLATRRRLPEIVPIGVLAFATGEFFNLTQPDSGNGPFWVTLAFNAIATAGCLSWGMYVGSRRELIWTLRQRAERAESEQELRLDRARATERARIAREMHDVLAHRISQVAMHAGALAFRTDLTAEEMRANASVIQEKAHEALIDLRGVLGVLRDADGELMDAPQPTYADLRDLVDGARATGLSVDYDDRVTGAADLPAVVGRTVYRIVQEGITNAHKHAPGALLSIELTGSPDEGVDVVLRNPLGFGSRTPGAGLGLAGLSERAQLRGGRLEHRRDGSSFVLHGWIPWAGVGPGTPVARVLVVDDDALVRSALALMLGGQSDVCVVGEAADGREGVRLAGELRPDVVLMDIRMPRMSGLEATVALHARPEPPHVIVLTTFDADEHVVGALAAGADGFLLKDTPPAQILAAIRAVVDGEPILSPSVTRTLMERVRADSRADRCDSAQQRLTVLTEREHEVAQAVGRGLTNAEIAQELYLSVPTVKAHVSRLFDKLAVTNRVQIAILVHDAGLA